MTRWRGGIVVGSVILLVLALVGLRPGSEPEGAAAAPPAPAAAVTTAMTTVAAPTAVRGLGSFTVTPRDLGMHSNHVKPAVPTGALRLNCYPTWRTINPAPGVFNWAFMDSVVDRARTWGYRDIVFSFCGTPEWAAGSVSRPDREVLGRKSTAAPKNMADWDRVVTEVVKRYKGRITAYQAWNEGTSNQFFQGTPAQLADMTRRLNTIVAKLDPAATVVSASLQQFDTATRAWGLRYLTELKSRGWPVEVYSFHGYPPTNTGANGRQSIITGFRKQLASLSAPSKPLWDTEVTYKTSSALSGAMQSSLVIRSYLDGWRMGVRRTYWYAWTDVFNPFGAIQMRPGYPAAKALKRFGDKVLASSYRGCVEGTNGLVKCRFVKAGKYFTIMWAEGRAVTVSRKATTKFQNMATGSTGSALRIKVGANPILVDAYV